MSEKKAKATSAECVIFLAIQSGQTRSSTHSFLTVPEQTALLPRHSAVSDSRSQFTDREVTRGRILVCRIRLSHWLEPLTTLAERACLVIRRQPLTLA